jgi:hypothetical protein
VGQVRLLKAQSVRRLTARPAESEHLERKSTLSNISKAIRNQLFNQIKKGKIVIEDLIPPFT